MSVKKTSLAALILLSLTACSSGGSSSNNQTLQNELNQAKASLDTAKKAEQAALSAKSAAEKASADAQKLVVTTNQDKQALQNELNSAKSALTKARTDLTSAQTQLNTAKSELSQVQADKTATIEQLASAKKELATAEQAKLQAEQALADKTALLTEIVNKAGAITEELSGIGAYRWISYNENQLSSGLSKHPFISISAANQDGIFVGNHYVYLTPDVQLIGREHTAYWSNAKPEPNNFRIQRILGDSTAQLPVGGEASYAGKGFNSDNLGEFRYHVDFANKTGSGQITQFNNTQIPTIQLEQGTITNGVIKSNALAGGVQGKYELGFYGENARSIAGEVYLSKEFDKGIKTNGLTAEKYGDSYETRGTVFGIAGERQ